MYKHIVMVWLFFVCLQVADGQVRYSKQEFQDKKQESREDTLDRFYFGGYLWATFGSFSTSVEIAPQVGYRISKRWDAGVGLKYMYFNNRSNAGFFATNNQNTLNRSSSHVFGGSVFTSFVAIENMNKILPFDFNGRLLTHLEYEALNVPGWFDDGSSGSRAWMHNYFVGGGLRQKIGERAYVSFLLLYNLNDQASMIYNNNPILRIRFQL
jgi:hypothetical protein